MSSKNASLMLARMKLASASREVAYWKVDRADYSESWSFKQRKTTESCWAILRVIGVSTDWLAGYGPNVGEVDL